MITAGYMNQISPTCNSDLKVKVVSREVYDEILHNKNLTDETYRDMMGMDERSSKHEDSMEVDIYE